MLKVGYIVMLLSHLWLCSAHPVERSLFVFHHLKGSAPHFYLKDTSSVITLEGTNFQDAISLLGRFQQRVGPIGLEITGSEQLPLIGSSSIATSIDKSRHCVSLDFLKGFQSDSGLYGNLSLGGATFLQPLRHWISLAGATGIKTKPPVWVFEFRWKYFKTLSAQKDVIHLSLDSVRVFENISWNSFSLGTQIQFTHSPVALDPPSNGTSNRTEWLYLTVGPILKWAKETSLFTLTGGLGISLDKEMFVVNPNPPSTAYPNEVNPFVSVSWGLAL